MERKIRVRRENFKSFMGFTCWPSLINYQTILPLPVTGTQSFIHFHSQHQHDGQQKDSDHAKYPVHGAFQNHQEDHCEKDQGGAFIPESHLGGGPGLFVLLKFIE